MACTTSRKRSARSTWRWRMSPSARPSARCSPTARRVQFMLADCASELYIGRLMLLHIAYKAEKGHGHPAGKLDRQDLPCPHGAQGDRHRDPAARRARLLPGYAAGANGTPRCARSGWSTVPTKCTSGRSARTSSRRSASTAPRRARRAGICFSCHRDFPLPLWERVALAAASGRVRGSINGCACDRDPSSGASRHLLPKGRREASRRAE